MNLPLCLTALAASFAIAAPPDATEQARYEFAQVQMGVQVRVILYAADEAHANRAAEAAFRRFEELNQVASDYQAESELMRLCTTAGRGEPQAVSPDLWLLLSTSQTVARMSDGAFDVTAGPLVRLWRRARRQGQLPSPESLQQARTRVGDHLLRLDPDRRTVELLEPGMQLDLGGIAKGFAGDEALRVVRRLGIPHALIDAGGDIVLGDPPPGTTGWRIGIAPLAAPDGPPSVYLSLANAAIATSGDAWQFVEIDGRRYSHLIDPRTGMALTERSSVTVVAGSGTWADALASAVSVLGPQRGLELIGAVDHAETLIVRLSTEGSEVLASPGFDALPRAAEPPRPL